MGSLPRVYALTEFTRPCRYGRCLADGESAEVRVVCDRGRRGGRNSAELELLEDAWLCTEEMPLEAARDMGWDDEAMCCEGTKGAPRTYPPPPPLEKLS